MQKGANFNLDAVKAQVEEAMRQHTRSSGRIKTGRAAHSGRPPSP